MRLSLSLKIGLLSALLVLIVAGSTTYLLVFRFGQSQEKSLVTRDRELARVLAGLRDRKGKLDFTALTTFVASADKIETGLVYALHIDGTGKLEQGALNPRLFARLDSRFAVRMRGGRERVLGALTAKKIERAGLIKEYALPVPGGTLRLGFDLRRIDRLIGSQSSVGLLILGIGLLLGTLASVLLARSFGGRIRKLAAAMEAVAAGNLDQTVQVASRDELASLADSFNQMTRALRGTEGQTRLAELYLSAPVAQRVSEQGDPLALAAEERALTVGVFELQGFDEQLQRGAPREAMQLLNDYLAPLIDAVRARGGVVLRLGVGRLQALWGAPTPLPDGELSAVRAALEARDAVDGEARRQQIAGQPALRLRAGLAAGRVALGNIGSAERLAYAAIGQPVTLAERIVAEVPAGEVVITQQLARLVPTGQIATTPFLPIALADGSEVELERVDG
jgi:class 3 adenylate cyclase